MGLAAPQHVGSSRTRAQTHVLCIGRRILKHCATREALINAFITKKKCQELIFEPSLYIRSGCGGVSHCYVGFVYSCSNTLSLFLEDLLLEYLGDFVFTGGTRIWREKRLRANKAVAGGGHSLELLSCRLAGSELATPIPPLISFPSALAQTVDGVL